jgi:peptide/nickel transport system permease protein
VRLKHTPVLIVKRHQANAFLFVLFWEQFMSDSPIESPELERKSLRTSLRKISKSYVFRVILQGFLTIWAASTFTFAMIRFLPSNPIDVKINQLTQQGFTYEEATTIASGLVSFDPSRPLLEQYFEYLGNLAQGNLGQSISSPGVYVTEQIMRFLPWTLLSIGSALLISFSLGTFIGMAMAYWRGSWFDNLMTGLASIFSGIPDYVFAFVIVLFFGVQLQWFNVGEMRGGFNPNIEAGLTWEYILDVLKHAVLPVTTYVLATIGVWMLTMKSSTMSVLGEDYIHVAKARGLPESRILIAYVGQNALLPLVTRLAINIGLVLSGSVIVEKFFEYPGLGQRLIRAIEARDYTTMQGIFLTITIAVILSNVLADLMLGVLDPRVRLDED